MTRPVTPAGQDRARQDGPGHGLPDDSRAHTASEVSPLDESDEWRLLPARADWMTEEDLEARLTAVESDDEPDDPYLDLYLDPVITPRRPAPTAA